MKKTHLLFSLFLAFSSLSVFASDIMLVRSGTAKITIDSESNEGGMEIFVSQNRISSGEYSPAHNDILNRLHMGSITRSPLFFSSSYSGSIDILEEEVRSDINKHIKNDSNITFLGDLTVRKQETEIKSFNCYPVKTRRFLRSSIFSLVCDASFESTGMSSL